jgi:mannose-6-phosphate isomerase
MDRVWGGRRLAEAYGRALPDDVPIGESWEVVDRAGEQSLVTSPAPLAGTTLHELWTTRRDAVFGSRAARGGERFPLLVKLLDASRTLSVQVHPPPAVAADLGGEPKSELWFVAAADPGAHLLVGLRAGVTRESFSAALEAGEDVSELLHRVDVRAGDAIHLPSGRVHAIGAGCLIVEVQQNSDTTYRVYDYGRPGLDGRPRELHVEQSMASIDFSDVEPALVHQEDGVLAATGHFTVTHVTLASSRPAAEAGECALVFVLDGAVACAGETFACGTSFLVPACADGATLAPAGDRPADALVVELPG